MATIWMHAPADLTPVAVPEEEMTLRQGIGWMHAEPPAAVSDSTATVAENAPAVSSDPANVPETEQIVPPASCDTDTLATVPKRSVAKGGRR